MHKAASSYCEEKQGMKPKAQPLGSAGDQDPPQQRDTHSLGVTGDFLQKLFLISPLNMNEKGTHCADWLQQQHVEQIMPNNRLGALCHHWASRLRVVESQSPAQPQACPVPCNRTDEWGQVGGWGVSCLIDGGGATLQTPLHET